MKRLVAIAGALMALGCGAGPRFADRPVVWQVRDDRHIAEPEEREFSLFTYYGDVFAMQALERVLEVHDPEPARNTNALDEVPTSTWFENRIGQRNLTPADIQRGPGGEPPALPLTVVAGKLGGSQPGFIAKDAEGRKFLIKFDPPDHPEMQTANAAVASRLFWAMGYHVPNEHVIFLAEGQIRIDPEARAQDELGDDRPFTRKALDKLLLGLGRTEDGTLRALASEVLPGVPKGGFSTHGVRRDDPNDRIPHEHRRELRGLRIFSAWLDHADINVENTLDMYVSDRGRRFLRHYLVDFGETLGGLFPDRSWISYAGFWDWKYQSLSLFSFGLWKRPWEGIEPAPYRSRGRYVAHGFDPALWREAKPYYPFYETTPADAFWAAKIVMRFRRPLLRAAVEMGLLSDERAARYLEDTLVARRNAIGRTYLEALSPLDGFEIRRGALCMRDLSIHHQLIRLGGVELYDDDGNMLASAPVARDGSVCIGRVTAAPYQIFRLRSVRRDERREPVEVHVKGGRSARVLGVIRSDDFG
jgi:hypothetical protein